ncbi:DUF4291 family protein [Streptomyces sp. NBC_01230]
MQRCGWATEAGQETVLAIEITRRLRVGIAPRVPVEPRARAAPRPQHLATSAQARTDPRPDPERDLHLRPLTQRSLQLGLSGEAVGRHADEWTVAVSDVTPSPERSTTW